MGLGRNVSSLRIRCCGTSLYCSRLMIQSKKAFSASAVPSKCTRNCCFAAPCVLYSSSCRQGTTFNSRIMVGFEIPAPASDSPVQNRLEDFPATELGYFQDMFTLKATATFLALFKEGDRSAVILDSTILHPQGGGQPADTGSISALHGEAMFHVEDVRVKNGLVYHYGNFDSCNGAYFENGQQVVISVDSIPRTQNSRLHSAGHLLDACMPTIGYSFEGAKGHHFPDSPFVQYNGVIPAADIERKRAELEAEANRLVTIGGPVHAIMVPYEEAAKLCGGSLPPYIAKDSTPRILSVGGFSCPCGGTHVKDVSEIGNIKISQIRVKKGFTKVSYNIGPNGVCSPS